MQTQKARKKNSGEEKSSPPLVDRGGIEKFENGDDAEGSCVPWARKKQDKIDGMDTVQTEHKEVT